VRIEKHPVLVSELVSYAVRHLPGGPGEVKIETHYSNPQQKVNVDAAKIEQVLLNLLLNAKQASPDGAKITISSQQNEDGVSLAVSDSGHGISAENLKHIFEPFFTTRKQGTGLGLSNAKKIIESHGGQILVKSEVNSGTDVRVTIPIV
jgi:signal transduction histidine kinase